ncbi:MAG TPA: hypothetical protein VGI63_00340 [Verrucomicrobiae bacterium]
MKIPKSGPWFDAGEKIIEPKNPTENPIPPTIRAPAKAYIIRARLFLCSPRKVNHQQREAAAIKGAPAKMLKSPLPTTPSKIQMAMALKRIAKIRAIFLSVLWVVSDPESLGGVPFISSKTR